MDGVEQTVEQCLELWSQYSHLRQLTFLDDFPSSPNRIGDGFLFVGAALLVADAPAGLFHCMTGF